MNLGEEALIFVRREDGSAEHDSAAASTGIEQERPLSVDDIFTPHDFGPWPEGFRCSREELYGDEGR